MKDEMVHIAWTFIVLQAKHPQYESDPAHAANQCANNIWFLDEWRVLEECANETAMRETILYANEGNDRSVLEDNGLPTLTSKSN